MKGQLYVIKKYSEKKGKSYVTCILKLNEDEIFVTLDKYHLLLLTHKTTEEFEKLEVGYKSNPIEFEF